MLGEEQCREGASRRRTGFEPAARNAGMMRMSQESATLGHRAMHPLHPLAAA